ncbi:hypothetical protein [Tengunoibacter tsumagoiensis]|uniref:Uncharacterized protein n=1 Tax=Tengunoibacter tsumagoiensis TaxID=2014871 RepID=A0A402A4W5_9CHLR|nr:hypothetical protein [Tengunoibacter tsumagoiensis]GCE14197.1 hypothetical protein KTT_40560 [Tengunoibacter tsumagoiensis]GCE14251.1 hypothetical protein KTT_41100 [Tengunoibacter tsumagoiensis]
MMNTYISVADYLRAPSGHDTSTLVSNVLLLSSSTTTGATTLPVTALTAAQSSGDRIYLFDGSATEIVTLTAAATIGATSLTCTPLSNAHTAGISLCSDGSGGSLASMIINASAQIEAFCRQPLLQASHSAERLQLRSMRAAMNRDYQLLIRPKQFPVTTVSAVTISLNASTTINLDASQAMIDADQQIVTIAQLSTTSGTVPWSGITRPLSQTTPGFVQISYTAGYAYASLPYDISQACIWLVSDLLSDRRNPTGAAEVRLGDVQLITRLRGETTGRSVLVMRAESALSPYRQRAF